MRHENLIELNGVSQQEINELIPQQPILVGYRGSIAHGMFVPNSDPNSIDDKDIMSVCVPDVSYYLGFANCGFGSRGVKEKWIREWDSVAYEARKFVSLLVKSNPNVISLLWLQPHHYIYVSPLGKLLIDARQLFVTKKIYHSFTGYAHGQLHRMTHQVFEGYMGQKRKGLVEKHGYDTKNAAHCIRLLRVGIEYLREGHMYVDRSQMDGPELLDIKRGLWSLEHVKEEADRLFKRAEAAYDGSQLPNEPDAAKVDALMIELLRPSILFWTKPN